MGWFTYYKLLKKYNGDLAKASKEEMDNAYKSNPNTPSAAMELAKRKYAEEST